MVFSSTVFLFGFLPIVVLINLLLDKKHRNIWLFLCSILFYAWNQPKYLWLLLCIILIDYAVGILIERLESKRMLLTIGIAVNVLALGYFKYYSWILRTINKAIQPHELSIPDLILPIGISFFTFKGISYLADVYNKKNKACRNLLNMALYISMFPEIMSGPIDKYASLENQLDSRKIDIDSFNTGIERFILGISKKIIIADTLGQIVDAIWSQGAGAGSWIVAWFGSVAYSMQLFFDFAGYTDMAIGLGKMLGFTFCENFNYPYISKTITEFWRRWHMSLGTWFKNYIYIPLGGNRKRVYLNLFIVFLLTGVWHGASWTFILWGILHGIFRLAEKKLDVEKKLSAENGRFVKIKRFLSHLYLLFVVNMLWVLFRAPSIRSAFQYYKAMFGIRSEAASGISLKFFLSRWNALVYALAFLLCFPIIPYIGKKLRSKFSPVLINICYKTALILLLLAAILRLVTSNYATFIYFQF